MIQRKVLITGVNGFIGRAVARYVAERGWQVIGVSSSSPENAPLGCLVAYYSLTLPHPQLNSILASHQPDVCIHCAGRASVGASMTDPQSDYYQNAFMTFETLNAVRLSAPHCRFIFLSSAAVYGEPDSLPISEERNQPNPISPYGFHKWQSEQLCLEFYRVFGIATTAVRIFSAYGSGLRRQVAWDICYKALTSSKLRLQGTGRESRDFIHVLDIAGALMTIVEQAPMVGEVYNLAAGKEVTIQELSNIILGCLDKPVELEFDGIVPNGNPSNWVADISKVTSLGFEAQIDLSHGIKKLVDWCKAEVTF